MRITESILIESLDRTSWGDSECVDKITLHEVLEYFKDKNIMPEIFDTRELFYKLSNGKEVLNIVKKGSRLFLIKEDFRVLRDKGFKMIKDNENVLRWEEK